MEVVQLDERIVKGASELYMKYGVRSVTMDDVAHHLSISKKTIYQFFKDKNELVKTVARARLQMEKEEYQKIFEQSKNSIEELAMANKCIRNHFHDMNAAMLFDLKKYHLEAWNLWLEFKNVFIKNMIKRNLKNGIEGGYFRKNIDPELLAFMRVEQVQLAFDESLYSDNYSLKDVQVQMFDHFVHGIVTQKGLKLFLKYSDDKQSS